MADDEPQPASDRHKQRKWQFSLLTLVLVTAAVSCAASACVLWRNNNTKVSFFPRVLRVIDAIGEFYVDYERIPTEEEGLNTLTRRDASPAGPYLNPTDAVDLWGNEIVYVVLDHERIDGYDLRSLGPNGIDDGGASDDFSVMYDIDVALLYTKRSQLVAWLFVASYVLAAVGIAREYRHRNSRDDVSSYPESSENSK